MPSSQLSFLSASAINLWLAFAEASNVLRSWEQNCIMFKNQFQCKKPLFIFNPSKSFSVAVSRPKGKSKCRPPYSSKSDKAHLSFNDDYQQLHLKAHQVARVQPMPNGQEEQGQRLWQQFVTQELQTLEDVARAENKQTQSAPTLLSVLPSPCQSFRAQGTLHALWWQEQQDSSPYQCKMYLSPCF